MSTSDGDNGGGYVDGVHPDLFDTGFTTKDSGEREQYASGMVRDTEEGKINYLLIRSGPMYKRWAQLLQRGAIKYSEDNWMQANSATELERFKVSAARHFEQWVDGDVDEDHAAAVIFNLNGYEYTRMRILADSVNAITEDDDGMIWSEQVVDNHIVSEQEEADLHRPDNIPLCSKCNLPCYYHANFMMCDNRG